MQNQPGVRWFNGVLVTLGVALGVPSLFSPLGRDQGVFFYIGREWLEGHWPYRDTFDLKPPGIHAVYALAIAVFGKGFWGIRILDLGAVILAGLCASFLVRRRPRAGAIGASVFATSLFYYGFFDFWNTAQCEIWCSAISLAALCAVVRLRGPSAAGLAGGALLAAAVLFKPLAVVFLPVLSAAVFFAPRRRGASWAWRLRTSLSFGLAAAMVFAFVAVAFARHDALRPMVQVLGVNAYYTGHGVAVHSLREVYVRALEPLAAFGAFVFAPCIVLAVTFRAAIQRGEIRLACARIAPIAMIALSVCGVVVQRRFYWYHWGLTVGPVAYAAARATDEIGTIFSSRLRPYQPLIATAALVLVFSVCGSSALTPETNLWGTTQGSLKRLTGALTREDYNKRFDFRGPYIRAPFYYSVPTSERIADWLNRHATVGDQLSVRLHEPQIYALTDLRFSGRFFWTTFLAYPDWSPPGTSDIWLQEDQRVFETNPPRWVVAASWVPVGPDSEAYFLRWGYIRSIEFDGLVILERTSEDHSPLAHVPREARSSVR